MKEIHHKDNIHLDAARKIRAEAEEHGFMHEFLGYGDVSVRLPVDFGFSVGFITRV